MQRGCLTAQQQTAQAAAGNIICFVGDPWLLSPKPLWHFHTWLMRENDSLALIISEKGLAVWCVAVRGSAICSHASLGSFVTQAHLSPRVSSAMSEMDLCICASPIFSWPILPCNVSMTLGEISGVSSLFVSGWAPAGLWPRQVWCVVHTHTFLVFPIKKSCSCWQSWGESDCSSLRNCRFLLNRCFPSGPRLVTLPAWWSWRAETIREIQLSGSSLLLSPIYKELPS